MNIGATRIRGGDLGHEDTDRTRYREREHGIRREACRGRGDGWDLGERALSAQGMPGATIAFDGGKFPADWIAREVGLRWLERPQRGTLPWAVA